MYSIAILFCAFAATTWAAGKEAPPQSRDPRPLLLQKGPHGSYDPHAALAPEKLAEVALEHQAEGRPGMAMLELDKAIERFPRNARLRAVRGSLYLQQGDWTQALKDLEIAAIAAPDDPLILTNRAQAYRQFGRIPEALADLRQALKLDPNLVAAWFNLGTIHYSSGDYRAALAEFDQCVALAPHQAAPYFNRAATKAALGDRPGGRADLEHFLKLSKNPEWQAKARKVLAQWQDSASGKTSGKTGKQP